MLQMLPNPPELVGYWAIWCAAGIILIELLLFRPGFFPLLIQLVALMTTSILFFYTRNFWLCWAMHVTVQLMTAPPAMLPLGSFAPQLHPPVIRAGTFRGYPLLDEETHHKEQGEETN